MADGDLVYFSLLFQWKKITNFLSNPKLEMLILKSLDDPENDDFEISELWSQNGNSEISKLPFWDLRIMWSQIEPRGSIVIIMRSRNDDFEILNRTILSIVIILRSRNHHSKISEFRDLELNHTVLLWSRNSDSETLVNPTITFSLSTLIIFSHWIPTENSLVF